MVAHVVRVKREILAACMRCPLCHNLLDEATTISECLHTFCRKCIFDKLDDEEVDCCPICNIDLGCVPVEKLRTDHNLQDLRAKIFPFKRRKLNAPDVSSIPLPVRRKERSLSSLVVSTPRVGTQTGLSGRRTKTASRKAATLLGSSPAVNGSVKKEDSNVGYCGENSNSPGILNKISQNRRQNSSKAETSKINKNNGESYLDNPLNVLFEAAKVNSSPHIPTMKTEQANGPDPNGHIPKKIKARENQKKSRAKDKKNDACQKIKDKKNGNILASSGLKAKTLCGINRKRDLATSAQALLDAADGKQECGISPIWFSLVSAVDQDGDASLPQLSANFLRIKNRNLPASFLQRYLVKKLDLSSEAEVDITCGGQQVDPTMPLHGLVGMWPHTGPSHMAQASVGSSAKDFIVVVTYRRPKLHN